MVPAPLYQPKSALGTAQQDIFSSLLSDRILMIYDEIDRNTACIIITQLLFLESIDPQKEIKIYINSPGGDVNQGLAIYDTIKQISCDVSTICVGEASSMGAFLLAAGTKGKRYALENSTIMIHQALGAIPYSQATDIKIQAEMIASIKGKLEKLLAEMTEKTENQIARDTDRDFYMTPFQAVEYGIIDEVITNEK